MNIRDRMLIAGISTTFIMMASTILFNEITAIWMMRILFILCLVALVAYGCFALYGNAVAKWHQTQARITKARNSVDFELMTGSSNTILVDYRARTAKRIGTTRRVETKPEAIEADHRDLLTLDAIIKDYPHIGVTGSTGAGKTTTMRQIIDKHTGQLYIFDPHDDLNMGYSTDNVDEFGDVIESVLFEYETRKAQGYRTSGRNDRKNILVVIDECLEALPYLENVTSLIVALTNGGRKYGIFLLLGSSVRTVGAFKMDGYGGLLHKNIRWIEMEKRGGKHSAKFYYDLKNSEEMENPGVFEPRRSGHRGHTQNRPKNGGRTAYNSQNVPRDPVTVTIQHDHDAEPWEEKPPKMFFETKEEKKAVTLYYELKSKLGGVPSLNDMAKKLFGYSNGKKTKLLAETLSKHGVQI